jgi:hypothetical protein
MKRGSLKKLSRNIGRKYLILEQVDIAPHDRDAQKKI